ncbi:hypothetical protein AB0O28_18760 [Microbispora sp. NPDC088329]|uniref:hypothetical protein n=1 Tax=Microbispora sp. NPDC088329 TaxID=3154869 RepID=UPI0034476EDB
MNLVKIVHPDGMEAKVPESAVPQHRASGWELADPPTPKERIRRILIDGGLDPNEAERVAAAAHPAEPPTETAPPDHPPKTANQTTEAPATAGASALPGQSRRRTTTRGDE